MGKWNRRYMSRPKRRYYQDYQWSPPRDEPCPDPETEDWQDNVPMWEKKFCYLVGRMPWKKVLSTKNFFHCHSNVLNWDDSAGKEAFVDAKKRFWEEMNGIPCESQLPNPDMYVDEINWNPHIDPGLVMELDQEYFNPDDKHYLPSDHRSKVNIEWPDDTSDPWEQAVQSSALQDKATWGNKPDQPEDGNNGQDPGNKWADDSDNYPAPSSVNIRATGWDQCDNSADKGCKASKGDDPWESHCTWDNKVGKNSSWPDAWPNSWNLTPQKQSDMSKNWSSDDKFCRNEGKRLQDHGASSSGWNQKKVDYNKRNFPTGNYKRHDYGPHHGNRVPNGRVNTWDHKKWDNSNWDIKDSNNSFRGHGYFNTGCRKRGPDQYATNHKGPRLPGADSQSNCIWNGSNTKRISFGGRW